MGMSYYFNAYLAVTFTKDELYPEKVSDFVVCKNNHKYEDLTSQICVECGDGLSRIKERQPTELLEKFIKDNHLYKQEENFFIWNLREDQQSNETPDDLPLFLEVKSDYKKEILGFGYQLCHGDKWGNINKKEISLEEIELLKNKIIKNAKELNLKDITPAIYFDLEWA